MYNALIYCERNTANVRLEEDGFGDVVDYKYCPGCEMGIESTQYIIHAINHNTSYSHGKLMEEKFKYCAQVFVLITIEYGLQRLSTQTESCGKVADKLRSQPSTPTRR